MKTKVSHLLKFFVLITVLSGISLVVFAQGGGQGRGAQAPPPPFKPTASDTEKTKDGDLKITPVNHAGVEFQLGNGVLADCVKAFKPKVVYPYHYRDNDPATDPQQFADALKDTKGVEVRMRNWY